MESKELVHMVSEAVIVGGISMYFYKKINDLETTVEHLKSQIAMQNNQLKYLLTQPNFNSRTTPLIPPQTNEPFNLTRTHPNAPSGPQTRPLVPEFESVNPFRPDSGLCLESVSVEEMRRGGNYREDINRKDESSERNCENGVCKLLPKKGLEQQSKVLEFRQSSPHVAISKVAKQIEYDDENNTSMTKINTFSNFSPNPVLKSVTPKPSTSEIPDTRTTLEKILNEIDNE